MIDEWEIVKLGDKKFFEIIMGQSPPSSTYNMEANGVPFIQGRTEFGQKYPTLIKYCSKPLKVAKKDDILLCVRAPVGDVNISRSKISIGRGLSAIRCNPNNVNHLYLYYYLLFEGKKLEIISAGSTFTAITIEDIKNFFIHLPPFLEQHKIAEILETIDNVLEKTECIIEKYKRMKRGLMHDLLTKGIGHDQFKHTKIGQIPKEWDIVELEKVSKIVSGGTPSRTNPNYYTGKIPWVKSGELKDDYITNTEEQITEKAILESSTKMISKNSLLIAMYGATVGKTAFLKINACINQAIAAVVVDTSKLDPYFVWYSLQTRRSELLSKRRGGAQPNLNQLFIKQIEIPFPPIKEQHQIAEIISQIDVTIEKEQQYKKIFQQLKSGLMQDLLTGKIRVNHLIKGVEKNGQAA